LTKDDRTYFFHRTDSGVVTQDISSLDPGADDENIAGWVVLRVFLGVLHESLVRPFRDDGDQEARDTPKHVSRCHCNMSAPAITHRTASVIAHGQEPKRPTRLSALGARGFFEFKPLESSLPALHDLDMRASRMPLCGNWFGHPACGFVELANGSAWHRVLGCSPTGSKNIHVRDGFCLSVPTSRDTQSVCLDELNPNPMLQRWALAYANCASNETCPSRISRTQVA